MVSLPTFCCFDLSFVLILSMGIFLYHQQACDGVRAEIERKILVAGRRIGTKYDVAKKPSRKVSSTTTTKTTTTKTT